jgi:putative heme-binding domain-containing protein
MPVVQKTGPDGCLYILDWYDRYHCYQDANADPEGIERAKGRLYRVRYKQSPHVEKGFDLAKKTDDGLIALLRAPNDFIRWTATRLLQERASTATVSRLIRIVEPDYVLPIQRRHAFFALVGSVVLNPEHEDVIAPKLFNWSTDITDPVIRAQSVRTLFRLPKSRKSLIPFLSDGDWGKLDRSTQPPEQKLQEAITLSTLPDEPQRLEGFLSVLVAGQDDPLIPRIVWQNLHPGLEAHATQFVTLLKREQYLNAVNATQMMPRIVERILGRRNPDLAPIADLFELLTDDETGDSDLAAQTLDVLAQRVQTRQIAGEQLEQLILLMRNPVEEILGGEDNSRLSRSALLLAASWRDENAVAKARQALARPNAEEVFRLAVLRALVSVRDEATLDTVAEILQSDAASPKFRADVIAALGDFNHERVASAVLASYAKLDAGTQPKAIELLTQRGSWAKSLLAAIGNKQVPTNALNQNQVRRLLEGGDEELKQLVEKHWGTIRTTRDPQRVELIAEMKKFVRANPGDAIKGAAVFKKVCGQCHKIYGEGAEVGPDITANGRGNFDQLLSNVFDPSLVIGASYQARTVITSEGRVLTGLPVEENDQRIVLKVQGGKLETIPRGEIDVLKVSELSMMPEQLEKQLKPEELADLFSFLILDKPPTDPNAKVIAGVREDK